MSTNNLEADGSAPLIQETVRERGTRTPENVTFLIDAWEREDDYGNKFEGITVVEDHYATVTGNTITSNLMPEALMPGLHAHTLLDLHARTQKRFRSVCISGILLTLVFGGCVYYLTNIDYIRFEVGVPALGGIIAILTGFLIGFWRNK